MKRATYSLTEEERILATEMGTVCRYCDADTAYGILYAKIEELKKDGVYIDPERIPVLIKEAKRLGRGKGAPAGMRFSFQTSERNLYR